MNCHNFKRRRHRLPLLLELLLQDTGNRPERLNHSSDSWAATTRRREGGEMSRRLQRIATPLACFTRQGQRVAMNQDISMKNFFLVVNQCAHKPKWSHRKRKLDVLWFWFRNLYCVQLLGFCMALIYAHFFVSFYHLKVVVRVQIGL